MFDEDTPLRQNWELDANCLGIDQEIFFPERGQDVGPAKEVCKGCIVKSECLVDAIRNNDKIGVKGGMSGNERRKLLKQLKNDNAS